MQIMIPDSVDFQNLIWPLYFFTGNIALHIFMPAERQKYDLESLWTVGTEFDENVQKELALDADPFAAYLKDFGKKTKQIEDQYVQIEKLALKTETSKAPYSKLRTLDSAGGWHSTDRWRTWKFYFDVMLKWSKLLQAAGTAIHTE